MPAIASSASSIDIANRCHNLRHPTRILYVRYSSRSWGASLFRGSWGRSQSAVIGAHRESDDIPPGATHKLDGDLLVVKQVRALEDDTERALSDLLAHPVVDTDHV